MRALIVVGLLLVAGGGAAHAGCEEADASEVLSRHVRAARWVDAHTVAEVLLALCPESPRATSWRVLDALALERLDEPGRARDLLTAVPEDSAEAPRARALLAWSYLRAGDRAAFQRVESQLSPEAAARLATLAAVREGRSGAVSAAAARLDGALRDAVLGAHRDYRRARGRSPALAGVLSAVLPGAGQAYAGSWQSAAVSFVLSGVLVGATVELARHELWFSAGATGLAASFFYVGNIMNAVDAAGRANDVASGPARRELERMLLPEGEP